MPRFTTIFTALCLAAWLGGARTSAQEPVAPPVPVVDEVKDLEQEAQTLKVAAADYQRKIEAAPAALENLARADAPGSVEFDPPSVEAAADIPSEEFRNRFDGVKEKLAAARTASQSHAEEVKSRSEKLLKLPGLITKAEAALSALPEPSAPPASAPEPEQAEHLRLLAQRALLQQKLLTLRAERKFYEATAELFAAQGASGAQRLATLEKSAAAWQRLTDQLRLDTTGAASERAQVEVEKFSGTPRAEAVARENAELAKRHGGEGGLSSRMAAAGSRLAALESQRERVSKQHASAIRRVKLLEDASLPLDATTGQLLRRQRQKLHSEKDLREQLREALRELAQAQIDLISLEERSAEVLAEPLPTEPESPELAQLKEARAGHLKSLTEDYRSHVATLSSITSGLRTLAAETRSFAQSIDARLLWIPSTEPISLAEPRVEAGAVSELFSAAPFATFRQDLLRLPILWVLVAIVLTGLVLRRRAYLACLVAVGAEARRRNCTSYVPTAKAFLYTLLVAAPLPALAMFIYSRAGDAPGGVADGLRNVAGFLTTMLTFWVVAHPQGLMIDHFRIDRERVAPLRRNFRWFVPVMPPLIFFATALPLEASASSAGRLFFIALLVALLVFFYRILRPSKHLIHWSGKAPNKPAKVCFVLGIAAPVALIIGAAAGYFASVQELRFQSLASIWIILVTLFVAAMLHRWILVSRRRLAVQQALKRRAAALAERKASTGTGTGLSDPKQKPQNVASPDEVKAEALKVVKVEEQTARLVRAAAFAVIAFGIWRIWMPTVPALSALDRVTLRQESGHAAAKEDYRDSAATKEPSSLPVTGAASGKLAPEGGDASPPGRVTLQDLAAAIIALFLTFVAAGNVPGLLELSIFRRLQLKPGSSFAFTTTIRYMIVVTGVVVALGMIDITWGKVQWIAAAITLGIGFGLQEIFANFVAGLIILFERPIRLGDVVTVGDVSGKVSQIRIRATTIRQFNSRELIVPNKEFITGKLVNWTLSDSILRFEVIVGIAYGSDTKKATEILLEVARENPKVLREPAPDVLFDDFGESALIFQLRAHVGNVDDLLPTRNEIRYAIDAAFRETGIEIAFPQTDVHIRTSPAQDGAEPQFRE